MKPESRNRLQPLFAPGLALALPLLLAACAAPQPPASPAAPPVPPSPAQVQADPVPMIVQPLPQAPSAMEVLLKYQQSLFQMTREDLQKVAASFPTQPGTPQAILQKAMALATLRGPGDLLRAQQLAEQVLRSTDGEARGIRPLAQLLATSYADLRRQSEQAERLAQQTREQQRRIEQLDHMLEGLKAIERNLATRPAASAPSPLK